MILLLELTRLKPQLKVVQIPESTYSPLPSELESYTVSQLYPTLKPPKKHSTSLSILLDNSTHGYKPSSLKRVIIVVLYLVEDKVLLRLL